MKKVMSLKYICEIRSLFCFVLCLLISSIYNQQVFSDDSLFSRYISNNSPYYNNDHITNAEKAFKENNIKLSISEMLKLPLGISNKPEILFLLGSLYGLDNNKPNQIKYYDKSIGEDPRFKDSYVSLIDLYANENNVLNVVALYNKFKKFIINYPDILLKLAVVFASNNYKDEALECYDSILLLDSNNREALNGIAGLYESKMNYKNAILSYEKLFTLEHNPEVATRIAICYYKIQNYIQSAKYFKMVLDKNPNNKKAISYSFLKDLNIKQHENSYNELLTLFAQKLNDPEAYSLLTQYIDSFNGADYKQNKQISDFKPDILLDKEYENILSSLNLTDEKKNSNDVSDTINEKGSIASSSSGQEPKKLSMYKKLSLLKPDNTKVLYSLAMEYYNNGEIQNSLDIANRVLGIDDKNIDALLLYNSLCIKSNSLENSKLAVNKLLELGMNSNQISKSTGFLYYYSNDYKSAIDEFKKVLQLSPEDTSVRMILALCFDKENMVAEEILILKEILKYDPDNRSALKAIVLSNLRIDSKEEAKKYLNKLLILDPNDKENNYLLGTIFVESYNNSAAEKTFKQIINNFPDEAEAYYQLANIYSRQEKFDQANKCLEKAVDLMPGNPLYHYALGVSLLESGNINGVKAEISNLKALDEGLSNELKDLIGNEK